MRKGDVMKAVVAAGALILAGTCAKAGTGWTYHHNPDGSYTWTTHTGHTHTSPPTQPRPHTDNRNPHPQDPADEEDPPL